MPRTQLRPKPHHHRHGEQAIEVWYDGRFIATLVAADGPSIRVLSDYALSAHTGPENPDSFDLFVKVSVDGL